MTHFNYKDTMPNSRVARFVLILMLVSHFGVLSCSPRWSRYHVASEACRSISAEDNSSYGCIFECPQFLVEVQARTTLGGVLHEPGVLQVFLAISSTANETLFYALDQPSFRHASGGGYSLRWVRLQGSWVEPDQVVEVPPSEAVNIWYEFFNPDVHDCHDTLSFALGRAVYKSGAGAADVGSGLLYLDCRDEK